MTRKILGINLSHNPSICLLTRDKDLLYFEEDRFNRMKYYRPQHFDSDDIFFNCINEHIIKAKNIPDEIIVADFDLVRKYEDEFDQLGAPTGVLPEMEMIRRGGRVLMVDRLKEMLKDYSITWHFSTIEHHLYHAMSGFHFSGFDEAICVVMDGGGEQEFPFYEAVESIYLFDKQRYKKKYVHATNYRYLGMLAGKHSEKHFIQNDNDVEYILSSSTSSGTKFAILCGQLGYKHEGGEAGKLMGLAAYGKSELDPQGHAMKLQIDTKEDTIKLLEKAFSYSPKIKNVVLSGGYALNCVNNYEYVKAFPEYNFFVDPVPHDGGTAIGAALWLDKFGEIK
jgi:carbamoyltransferase